MVELLSGRYRVGEPIGAGGSARVFRGRDERLGRDVAIKLLDDAAARSADPAARRRFENEARSGARFVHPNAVTVFDAGSDQGQLFLVMELLSGGSLAERLAESGPMEPSAVALLGVQIGGALAAGHASGLVHRDVKPSNVLFADDGTAKLADFGIARRFDEIEESLTDTGMVMGTRQYVSPEQAAGLALSGATDQFSLGVTLFEAATGTRPPTAVERGPDDVLDPTRMLATVPTDLGNVIATATAMRAQQRFASMSELTAALDASAGSEAADATAVGTATMPARYRPDRGVDPFGRTVALASGAGGGRGRPRRASSAMASDLAAERRRKRLVAGAGVAAAAAAAAIGFVALASTGDDEGDAAGSVPGPAPSVSASAPTTSAPSPTSPATSTTIAPTTTTTSAPTTSIAELIPGFPVPADEQQFLATLGDDPDIAGQRGDDLAKRFERILEVEPDERDKEADRLRKEIDKWLDKNEIDPTIAATAGSFLDELAPSADSADDD